jgi:hypothetical protein
MSTDWRRPYGLRPTLRHLVILVLGAALASSVAFPALRGGSPLLASFVLPLTLPLLSALVLLFDRAGPVKYWLSGLLGLAFLPALILWVDAVALTFGGSAAFLMNRGLSTEAGVAGLALLNVLGVLTLSRLLGRLPRRCPACGRRSLLPLGRMRWCASCGPRRGARP